MKDIRMIHVADLGLRNLPYGGINPKTGLNRRFEDVLVNFKFVISEAIRQKVKYFVIAGDINEERNPESILIEKFSGAIADLIASDINVIIVAGNHDLDSAKGTSTSVSYIKSLGLYNTFVADLGPETFVFDDVVFHCLPTVYPSQLGLNDNDQLSAYLDKKITDIKINPGKHNILVAHYSLDSTFAGLGVDEAFIKGDSLSKFDYVALGHIHKYEMFTSFKGGYSGSLFVKDFGEQFDKYFNLVTVKKDAVDIEKVSVPERMFAQYEFDATNKEQEELLKEINQTITKVKGAIIKIKLKSHKRFNPKLIYAMLKVKRVFHYVPIEWDILREDKIEKLDDSHGVNDEQIVDTYLGRQEIDKGFKKKVSSYTKGVIKQWEECGV